jgi:hypothetical protein
MALSVEFKRQLKGLDGSLAEREVAGLTGGASNLRGQIQQPKLPPSLSASSVEDDDRYCSQPESSLFGSAAS